jgi:putative tricarboxylic transport membrane protein
MAAMSLSADKFTSLFLMLLSVFLWLSLDGMPPDIAYYPKALIACLIGCAVYLFVQSFIRPKLQFADPSECTGFVCRRPTLELVSLSIVYILVLPYIGFIASSVIFLVVLMWRLEVRHWAALTVVPIATVVLVYLGFEEGLMVPLPDGYAVWSLFQ